MTSYKTDLNRVMDTLMTSRCNVYNLLFTDVYCILDLIIRPM